MIVGFSSSEYSGGERPVTVCVEVVSPPSGGALRPFSLALLAEFGMDDFMFALI